MFGQSKNSPRVMPEVVYGVNTAHIRGYIVVLSAYDVVLPALVAPLTGVIVMGCFCRLCTFLPRIWPIEPRNNPVFGRLHTGLIRGES